MHLIAFSVPKEELTSLHNHKTKCTLLSRKISMVNHILLFLLFLTLWPLKTLATAMLASRKLNQAQSSALRHYNSPLDAMRMLFTTENNGCVWKYTSDAYSAFQPSEMNASPLILSSCVFIYLFIYYLPTDIMKWLISAANEKAASLSQPWPFVHLWCRWAVLLGKSPLPVFQRCKRFRGVRKGDC